MDLELGESLKLLFWRIVISSIILGLFHGAFLLIDIYRVGIWHLFGFLIMTNIASAMLKGL